MAMVRARTRKGYGNGKSETAWERFSSAASFTIEAAPATTFLPRSPPKTQRQHHVVAGSDTVPPLAGLAAMTMLPPTHKLPPSKDPSALIRMARNLLHPVDLPLAQPPAGEGSLMADDAPIGGMCSLGMALMVAASSSLQHVIGILPPSPRSDDDDSRHEQPSDGGWRASLACSGSGSVGGAGGAGSEQCQLEGPTEWRVLHAMQDHTWSHAHRHAHPSTPLLDWRQPASDDTTNDSLNAAEAASDRSRESRTSSAKGAATAGLPRPPALLLLLLIGLVAALAIGALALAMGRAEGGSVAATATVHCNKIILVTRFLTIRVRLVVWLLYEFGYEARD